MRNYRNVSADIQLGSRVYLSIAIAGDPGCVVGFDGKGRCIVEWYDLGITTVHPSDRLVLDKAFTISKREFSFDFGEMAA